MVVGIFTDVNNWLSWQEHITAAHMNGKRFAPGNSFTWTSEGFTVTSHIALVKRDDSTVHIVWQGTSQGITGTHEWIFESTATGTRVVTTESFAGAPVDANLPVMQGILDSTLPFWLDALKNKAEATS